MEREEIVNRLKKLLKDNQFMSLRTLVDSLNDGTSLINDLAMDSIQILELIVGIENEFSFTCDPRELSLEMFDRFDRLVNFVQNKVGSMVEQTR